MWAWTDLRGGQLPVIPGPQGAPGDPACQPSTRHRQAGCATQRPVEVWASLHAPGVWKARISNLCQDLLDTPLSTSSIACSCSPGHSASVLGWPALSAEVPGIVASSDPPLEPHLLCCPF